MVAVAEDGFASTSLTGAQGVVVGTGNSLVAHFHGNDQWRNSSALGAFSAHAAADKISEMDHDTAIRELASAPVEVSAEVLRVILGREPDRTVGLLSDINPTRANELITALLPDAHWLEQLPVAVIAIRQCREAMGWRTQKPLSSVVQAEQSRQWTMGYFQAFPDGNIHWSEHSGAHATVGTFIECHAAHGGSGGRLGFPLSAEISAEPSPHGTAGSLQRFESTFHYDQKTCDLLGLKCGATIYRSASHGTFATWGGIGEFFELNGSTSGWLGFPISDEIAVTTSPRGTVGWIQHFEGGIVSYTDAKNAIAMPETIAAYHIASGGASGTFGFPVSPARSTGPSPAKTIGTFQCFEPKADTSRGSATGTGMGEVRGATIYSSGHGTYAVDSDIAALFDKLGGPTGWLGFPLEDEHQDRAMSRGRWCQIQHFEGGLILRHEFQRTVAVPVEVMQLVDAAPDLARQIGFPQTPLSGTAIPGTSIQLFENGVATVRDGVAQVWVAP